MYYRRTLNRYIDAMHDGNRASAARAWGVKYATLANVCNGYKGMSKDMATRICVGSGMALERDRLAAIRAIPGKRNRAAESA